MTLAKYFSLLLQQALDLETICFHVFNGCLTTTEFDGLHDKAR